VFVLFWAAYFGQMLLVKGTTTFFVFLVLFLTLLMPVLIRYLIIKYKYNGEAIDPATGKPRVLTAKWFKIILFVFAGILMSLALSGFVYNLIVGKTLYDILSTMSLLPTFITVGALLLAVLHVKKKMTVSGKLIYSLIAIAIVISLAIIGIAYFMNFSTLCNPGFLFSVALSSYMALTFHRMRKS
jgi:hypothetical protein